ncbi:MAG: NifU family protein [Flavobacteriales bacterium]|nr:NifU family protein [Flavobacteriales bacterium]
MIEIIRKELELIRPYLQADDGDVTLEEVTEDFVVKVKLWGACCGCSMSPMTMRAGIEEAMKKAVPQVKEVVAVNDSRKHE